MIQKKHQYITCIALFLLGVAFFGFTLDRYPAFAIDEPFFNISAVRHVEGKSFAYDVHSDAPHNGDIWAFHGPLFFRMQVLTHRLFGISHFAARFPSYLAGNLAVLLMAVLLIRKGQWPVAICLQVLWLGDRSLLENMGGRQEGVSHLCAVAAALLLIPARGRRGTALYIATGFLIGLAAGFNPAGIYYTLAVALFLVLTQPLRKAAVCLCFCAAGGLLAGVLVVWCWLPDIPASLSQFLWHYEFNARLPDGGMVARALSSWQRLRWALPWNLVMLASCVGALIYSCVLIRKRIRKGPLDTDGSILMALATAFAAVSVVMYLSSSLFTTYLVYLTTWAALFARLAARKLWHGKRSAALLLTVLVIAAWLPSAAWNALRFREAITTFKTLDRSPVVEILKKTIPEDVRVFADPHLYVEAHEAGVNYTPLHWYISDVPQDIPDDAWIVFSERYDNMLNRRPAYLARRELKGVAVFAPESPYHRWEYRIMAPKQ